MSEAASWVDEVYINTEDNMDDEIPGIVPVGIENIVQRAERDELEEARIRRTGKVSTKKKYDDRYKISKGKNKHGGTKRNFSKAIKASKPGNNEHAKAPKVRDKKSTGSDMRNVEKKHTKY